MQRHGAPHDEVPDYSEPDMATIATLNIKGGNDNSKARMLAPVLDAPGPLARASGIQAADLTWYTEIQNTRLAHEEFAARFGSKGTAVYVTAHVMLVVGRNFLGHELKVTESQEGRVLQIKFSWHGEPMCITGIYAPGFTIGKARQRFYNQLHIPVDTQNQIILGDFNHTPGTNLDTNNNKAPNIGLKQWRDFVGAHEMQSFADSIHHDNDGEKWHTWEGRRAWGHPHNQKRRLDRIELSATIDQIDSSWATTPPWGTLDHAMVSVGIVAPGQRQPPSRDPDAIRPMSVSIIESPAFLKRMLPYIAMFNAQDDAREQLDLLLARARHAHDECVRADRKPQLGKLKQLREQISHDGDTTTSLAKKHGKTAVPETISQWHEEAREVLAATANDLHCEREILSADFSHHKSRQFFTNAQVKKGLSTFPYQMPYKAGDDVQKLNPHMAHARDGGMRQGDSTKGWSSQPTPPPPPVSKGKIKSQKVMLKNTLLFYKWLFRERRWHKPSRRRVLAAMQQGPCFDPATAARMGADITPAEIEHAVTLLQKGKAPGPNGVPSEFFITLGPHISHILASFANTVRDKGGFTETQRQGNIVLQWKGSNKGHLQFYRPLTLLNRETSVIEAVITDRLARTLPTCIAPDQTGFLSKDGRRMSENIIKMLDCLQYSKDKDLDLCAISVDQVKAFDRLSRDLLFQLYDIICGVAPGSNHPLTVWVRALMANQERRVMVNGEFTDSFTLHSGIPQGAILSVISYTLFSESLARLLLHGDAHDGRVSTRAGQPTPRAQPTVPPTDGDHPFRGAGVAGRAPQFAGLRGMATPSRTARMCTIRYADDIVLVLHPSEVSIALDICEIWNAATGMARNDLKTEGMWIGKRRDSDQPWKPTHHSQTPGGACYATEPDSDSRIVWLPPGSSLKILGVMVGYNVDVRGLWQKIARAMFTQFRLWQLVKLSYLERVLVCKVMVWSKAFFLAAYHPPPADVTALLTVATQCFIQTGYIPKGATLHTSAADFNVKPLFKDGSTSRPRAEGGLSMWDPNLHMRAQLAKWVILLLQPQIEQQPGDSIVRWTTLGRYYITEYTSVQRDGSRGAHYLVDGRLRRPNSTNSVLPTFWRNALAAWHDVRSTARVQPPTTRDEVLSMPLWSNHLVACGLTRPPPGWMACGIHRVRDLWDAQRNQWRDVPALQARARAFGAPVSLVKRITRERALQCERSLPANWCQLLRTDRDIQDGDLYAERGVCIDSLDGDYAMLAPVWRAVVTHSNRLRTVRWKCWEASDQQADPPAPRVRKGEGPAGLPAPVHDHTPHELAIFTDGGCVENARVSEHQQLAGAGAAVLNGTREGATGTQACIYCPVHTDPTHPLFLGAERGTNNTAELVGVAEALLWLRDHDLTRCDVCLYVDSKYAPAVVQAEWGFRSNIALVKTIQHILVQVRAVRNIRFAWVHGHSGDKWNDVADELATLGQHLDEATRTGCQVGRHAPDAPTTALVYDPRHGAAQAGEHLPAARRSLVDKCVPASQEPSPARMHRVSCTRAGRAVGFSTHHFSDMTDRVLWGTPSYPTTFTVKGARTALQDKSTDTSAAMHKHAARLAQCYPGVIDIRWPQMWREGWAAPWPPRTQDMWWRMAAGGQPVAHLRRHYDPATATCRVCARHCDQLHLDTHTHLYYTCPGQQPLWTWAQRCLGALGMATHHAAGFMLYGLQMVGRVNPAGPTDTAIHPHERRALQLVRAAVVEAFYSARTASTRPEAEGVHPQAAPQNAAKLLKNYIHLDFYAATRSHSKHARLIDPPPGRARGLRPGDIGQFAKIWHLFARVQRRATLKWQGPLGA